MNPTSGPVVTVVGAGMVGSSIARRLAMAGRRVRLVDAREAGKGATAAAAGMLALGGECDTDSAWLRLGLRSMELYPGWVRELEEETGLAIDFSIGGALEQADADPNALALRCERQRSLGIPCEMRGDAAFYPGDGAVDPRGIFQARLACCRRLGVEIAEHQPVERIDDDDGPVVIAAGAWSGAIPVFSGGRRLDLPRTTPVKGHLIAYSLAPGSLPHILRCGHTYIVQRASGFTIAGTTSQQIGFDETLDAEMCLDVRRRAEQLWPELRQHAPCAAWTGLRPLSETGEPVIGAVEGGRIWLAYGHYRNGILLAPVTAEIVAGGIQGVLSRVTMDHSLDLAAEAGTSRPDRPERQRSILRLVLEANREDGNLQIEDLQCWLGGFRHHIQADERPSHLGDRLMDLGIPAGEVRLCGPGSSELGPNRPCREHRAAVEVRDAAPAMKRGQRVEGVEP
jgi:glycine oxidase